MLACQTFRVQGAESSETTRLVLACANVADLLAAQAASRPDAVALVQPATDTADVRRELTWAELDARVDAVAAGLSGRGLRAGQRVGLCAANGIEFVVCYLAALRCGLLAVPINPRSATGEVVRVLADSRCRLVVADAATAPTVRAAVGGLVDALAASSESVRAATPVPQLVVTAGPVLPGDLLLEEVATTVGRVASPVDPESLAVLLHTSGTSGRPRAAMLTHRALLANVSQLAAIEPPVLGGDDVVLGLLPLFHVYGLNAMLGQVLAHGARLVLVERFDADETLAVVEDEQVTNLPVVPAVIAAWAGRHDLAERLRSVRLAVSGAAPLEPELAALFTDQTGVRLEQGYGLTECAPVVTSTLVAAAPRSRSRSPAVERSSVGGPLPGVTLRIVDSGGNVLEPGDVGEVCVRGDNLFSGYWPDRHDGPDAEGWWRTGDLGLLDPDGHLELVDRLRELVIVSGFNVYPFEVEEVISEVPGVAGAAVIGVADPDTGEAVVAYIVLSPDAGNAGDVADSVRSHCAERLARFKRPRTVNVVSGLPYSATGKVAKGRLRAQARRELLGMK